MVTDKGMLRLAIINVNMSNTNYASVENFIAETEPDIVVLIEINHKWYYNLKSVYTTYQFQSVVLREDYFGIGVFSKQPFVDKSVHYFRNSEIPAITVTLEIDETPITLLAVHLDWPVTPESSMIRNKQLHVLAKQIRKLTQPVIVAGDFNMTPWSFHYTEFITSSDVSDCSNKLLNRGTWPTWMGILALPIDYCFTSDHILVDRYIIGPDIGSDHYPVLADLRLK